MEINDMLIVIMVLAGMIVSCLLTNMVWLIASADSKKKIKK